MPRPFAEFDEFVGRGRKLKVETVAREAGVSETTVWFWCREDGKREPSFSDLQLLLGSTLIPLEFKLTLANALFRLSHDLNVTVCGTGAHEDAHPMKLAIDGCEDLNDLLRLIDDAQCPRGPGGASITSNEAEAMASVLSRFDVLTARLRKAIERRRLRSQAG